MGKEGETTETRQSEGESAFVSKQEVQMSLCNNDIALSITSPSLFGEMEFACTDRVDPRGDGAQPLSRSQRRQRLSRALQRTTLNALIFDTGRLLLSHSDPTRLSLPPSLSLRHCLPLPLSLTVTGSDREQMLHGTATTEPDTTTRTLPLCHIRLFNALDPAEDICPVLGDAERKAVDANESKAGFNRFDYRGSLAISFVRTTFA